MKKIFVTICVFLVFLVSCQKTTNVPVKLPELTKAESVLVKLPNIMEIENVSVKLTETKFIVIECGKMNSPMSLKQDVNMWEIEHIPPYMPYKQIVELLDTPTFIFLPKEISAHINVDYYQKESSHYLSFTADEELWGYDGKIIIVFGQNQAIVVNVKLEGGMGKG